MPTIIIRATVADYDRWKPVFDEHKSFRREFGLTDVGLYRDAAAPNDIVIVFGADDLERAHEFGASESLREAMQRSGVISEPTIWFLNEAEPLATHLFAPGDQAVGASTR
jgi:hypothetical protein